MMRYTSFCKKVDVTMKKAIWNWAKRLEATDITVHRDGTITLTCPDGYICNRYTPTAKELYRH